MGTLRTVLGGDVEERQLKDFIVMVAYADPDEVRADTPLFSSGIIDSVSLLELVAYVEQHAGIKVSPSQVTLSNWDSIEKILNFVATAAA